MRKRNYIIGISILTVVLSIVAISVGCSVKDEKFDVSANTDQVKIQKDLLETADDIKNIVTDDDKLVINYYDAYTWIVLFDENDYPKNMMYVYKFESEENATKMINERKKELEMNRSIKVTSAKVIDEFLIIELEDSSFDKIPRGQLEYNFNGLIKY